MSKAVLPGEPGASMLEYFVVDTKCDGGASTKRLAPALRKRPPLACSEHRRTEVLRDSSHLSS